SSLNPNPKRTSWTIGCEVTQQSRQYERAASGGESSCAEGGKDESRSGLGCRRLAGAQWLTFASTAWAAAELSSDPAAVSRSAPSLSSVAAESDLHAGQGGVPSGDAPHDHALGKTVLGEAAGG